MFSKPSFYRFTHGFANKMTSMSIFLTLIYRMPNGVSKYYKLMCKLGSLINTYKAFWDRYHWS